MVSGSLANYILAARVPSETANSNCLGNRGPATRDSLPSVVHFETELASTLPSVVDADTELALTLPSVVDTDTELASTLPSVVDTDTELAITLSSRVHHGMASEPVSADLVKEAALPGNHSLLSNIDRKLNQLRYYMQLMTVATEQGGESEKLPGFNDPSVNCLSTQTPNVDTSKDKGNLRRSQHFNLGILPEEFKEVRCETNIPSLNAVFMAKESDTANKEEQSGKTIKPEEANSDRLYKDLTHRMMMLERSLSAFSSLDITEPRLRQMEHTEDPYSLGAPSLPRQLYSLDQTGARPRCTTGASWDAGHKEKNHHMHHPCDTQQDDERYNVPLPPFQPGMSTPQPSATEHKISTSDYIKGASQTPEDEELANQPQAKARFIIFKLLRLRKESDCLKSQLLEGLEASSELQQPTETSHKRFEEFTKQYAGLQKRHEDLVGDTLGLESVPEEVINSMEYLDNMNIEIEGILVKLKKRCSASLSQNGSITNISYIELERLDLDRWTGPILFETVKKWEEIQKTNCGTSLPAQKFFVEKCINSISDVSITVDIRQNCQPTNLKQLVDYLIDNYGKPSQVQSILLKKHLSQKKIEWPLTESNSEQTYQASKIHISVMNSAESMITFFESKYGLDKATILLQDGIYSKQYFTILANIFPTEIQSTLKYTLSKLTPKGKFYELKNQFIRLKNESHNLTTNWAIPTSITQNQNKGRLMIANVGQDSIQQLPPLNQGPMEQPSPLSSGTRANGQERNLQASLSYRQGNSTITEVADTERFNKWLVTNFEDLLAGEPMNFKRLEGMDTLVPDSTLPHIPEPQRQAILSLMGKKTGCHFCLKLIEMNATTEKQVIFPHLITCKPRDTLRIAKGIKFCPMILHLNLADRLMVLKEVGDKICTKCLAYKAPEMPCRNCLSSMGDVNKRPHTCITCQVHLFFCSCRAGVEETEKAQHLYIGKLKSLLKNPLNNSCIVGLPDPRIYCLAITRTLFPDQTPNPGTEPMWQSSLPKSPCCTTTPRVRSCQRCTLRLDMGEDAISGSSASDHQPLDTPTRTNSNTDSPHLHDWDRVESCMAEVSRCISTLKKNSLMTRNVDSPRNTALCYKKPHLLFNTKEQLLASSNCVVKKSSGTNMFLSFYIIGEDYIPRLFIWDSGSSHTILLRTLPGQAFKSQFIARQSMEVAGGTQFTTEAYNILLPLKTSEQQCGYKGSNSRGASYVMSRALTLENIITEIPTLCIKNQVDIAYDEYTKYRFTRGLAPEFMRSQCPNTYGGKPSGLIPMEIFHPQLLFRASNGICFYNTPFESGTQCNIAIGGVLHEQPQAVTSLIRNRLEKETKELHNSTRTCEPSHQEYCMQTDSDRPLPINGYGLENNDSLANLTLEGPKATRNPYQYQGGNVAAIVYIPRPRPILNIVSNTLGWVSTASYLGVNKLLHRDPPKATRKLSRSLPVGRD